MQRTHSFHSHASAASETDSDDAGEGAEYGGGVTERVRADARARQRLMERVQVSRQISNQVRGIERRRHQRSVAVNAGAGAGAGDGSGADRAAAAALSSVQADNAFQRVVITGSMDVTAEQAKVCRMIGATLKLREKYTYKKPDQYWGGVRKEDLDKAQAQRPRRDGITVHTADLPATPRTTEPVCFAGTAHTATGNATGFVATTAGGAGGVAVVPAAGLSPRSLDEEDEEGSGIEEDDSDSDVEDELEEVTPVVAARRGLSPALRAASPAPGMPPMHPELTAPTMSDSIGSLPRSEPKHHGVARRMPPLIAFTGAVPTASNHTFRMVEGVVMVYETGPDGQEASAPCVQLHSFGEFRRDYNDVVKLIHFAPFKSFAYKRMQLLRARFDLHKLLNADKELSVQKVVPHRDFYNVWKVDTHVHHSACMNQKTMLRFIKRKLRHHPNELVIFRDGQFLTLAEVFKSLSITAYDLSIDTLDMHADSRTFHRFDRFNLKYNPCGQSRLREIFLKTDNVIAGRYLAEITTQVFEDLEKSKYQLAEYRVSIYGRKPSEWDKLARWVWVHRLASPNVRWLIQVPRLYEVYKKTGQIDSFQDMLDNLFLPLFKVSVDPSSNPMLHHFLRQVVGFDCVDDESKHEQSADPSEPMPPPAEWTQPHSPPYFYWVYYLSANLMSLNQLRSSKGLSTFSFRPHSGEAGDVAHLAATFLTAESINHGITMRKSPALQYLYYLTQIGLAMSPLSNNKLFVDYHRNPFHTYFACGLNVSLSTDDPLILHYTREPLVEEYCVAAQVWKLSSTDMCEIARNSVLQSGFEHPYKAHFIGDRYHLPGPAGNNIRYTNVPNIRLQYRQEVLTAEHDLIAFAATQHNPSASSKPPVPTGRPNPPPVPAVAHAAATRAPATGSVTGFLPRHPMPRFAGPRPSAGAQGSAGAAGTRAAAVGVLGSTSDDSSMPPPSPVRTWPSSPTTSSPLREIMAARVPNAPPTTIELPPPSPQTGAAPGFRS